VHCTEYILVEDNHIDFHLILLVVFHMLSSNWIIFWTRVQVKEVEPTAVYPITALKQQIKVLTNINLY
jgi:hypothetical protein